MLSSFSVSVGPFFRVEFRLQATLGLTLASLNLDHQTLSIP